MEVSAKMKGAQVAAQKARLVANQIRGKSVEEADFSLNTALKKALCSLRKFSIQQLLMRSITKALM